MLSDFRTAHQTALDELLTGIVATMMASGLVTLREVSQDGLRVRAGAGAGSFRRRARLEECLEVARERVKQLAKQREHPDTGVSQRERAARERAARERLQRVEAALRQLPEAEATKERQAKRAGKERAARLKEARTSTTDPDARVMKMADGGYRPAFNVQLATDKDSQVITGVSVTKCTNARFRERYGVHRFLVRGLAKATCLMLLVAIAHNLMRWTALSS